MFGEAPRMTMSGDLGWCGVPGRTGRRRTRIVIRLQANSVLGVTRVVLR